MSRQRSGVSENSVKDEFGKYWFLVSDTEKKKARESKAEEEEKEKEEKYILCGRCENKITLPAYRVDVNGSFEHTFLNPGAQVYRIGCFQIADGCISLGVPTAEWTWFQGFEWQVTICGRCFFHLGWFYRAMEEQSFYGLILDELI